MNIKINERKVSLTDDFKQQLDKRLQKLDRFFGGDTKAEVTVKAVKDGVRTEITVKSGGDIYRAERSARDKHQALDSTVDNLIKQIVKHKGKLETKIKQGAFKDYTDYEELPDYTVVKTKNYSIKPMDTEEAILQMDLIDHDFFVFYNDKDSQVNVVYRRDDGYYGVLVPEA